MESLMNKMSFQCCFCAKGIEENKVDPIDINIVFNEDMKMGSRSFRNFYAHFYCFKEKLHKSTQGYLVRSDEED
jgi:hypothetical protein